MDSLRILEVLTSNHLELSSDRAAIEQEKIVAEEFAADGNTIIHVHACRCSLNPFLYNFLLSFIMSIRKS